MFIALITKLSISVINGITTILVLVFYITAGSINNMLLLALVGSTLIAVWFALSAIINYMLLAYLLDC